MSKRSTTPSDILTPELPVSEENLALIYKTALEIKIHEVSFLKRENSIYKSTNSELKRKINLLDDEIATARHELADMQRSITEVWKRSAEMSQSVLMKNNMQRPLLLKANQRIS